MLKFEVVQTVLFNQVSCNVSLQMIHTDKGPMDKIYASLKLE